MVELRAARGLTQVQLAEAIGSSQRAISRYETIAEFPPASVVIELAKALGVTTDELFGIKKPRDSTPRDAIDPKTKRLWKKFQLMMTLPEKDRRAVTRLVNSLVAARPENTRKAG